MRRSKQPCWLRNLTLLGFVLSGFGSVIQDSSAEETAAVLKWRNGDELEGRLLAGNEKTLQFEAAPFAEPIVVSLEQLEGIRFSETSESKRRPAFRVLLTNGDRLEGSLQAISKDSISFLVLPFTESITIDRKHVERLVHIGSEYLRYSGPNELTDWSSTGRDRKVSEWFTDLTGAFATHQWSGNLFREIEFPSAVEIRFEASFPRGQPNVEIGLIRGVDLGPMIETWGNSLVLTYRSDFVPIMELSEETRRLDFRLFWDQTSGRVLLCEPSGRELASLEDVIVERRSPDSTKSRLTDPLIRGFSILNRTPELKLQSLSVQEWDGSQPQVVDLSRPRILLAGRAPRFDIGDISYSRGSSRFRSGSRSYPLEELQELILNSPPPSETLKSRLKTARLAWADGSNLSGSLLSLDEETISIATEWSSSPLSLSLASAKQIRFPISQEPLIPGGDRLSGESFDLYGAARPLKDNTETSLIGWQPPGAETPVPFADDLQAKVTRFPHASTNPDLSTTISQARLYLKNDEILVGSLLSVDTEEVSFTSRTTGPITIPSEKVEAIDLGSAGRVLEGFDDPAWEEVEEVESDVELTRDTAILRAGSFGNPSLVLGDRIHFTAQWKQTYGAVTLRLFTLGADENSPSTDLIIAAQGNRLFVGKLKESGAFSFSGDQIPLHGDTASFEIRLQDEEIAVIINEKTTLEISVNAERVSGNGIYFKMGGGWQGWNQAENEITISEFRIERTPGSLPRRIIDPVAKEMSLQLPRSRRDPRPTHLLIAPNGDLLRGNLLEGNADGFRFAAAESEINLPAERISAIVWLEEAKEMDPEHDPDAVQENHGDLSKSFLVTHQFVLMNGSRLNLNSDSLKEDRFVGTSSVLGACSIAIDNVREMRRGPATPLAELEPIGSDLYADWELIRTPDPAIPGSETEPSSPLIGKPAPEIQLTMLDESTFDLSSYKGKVVVLDFWATWCGPCIKAMPEVKTVVEAFPAEAVVLCTINQSESIPIIHRFLESRDWNRLPVALDFDMNVSQAYLATEIPHTVVIGKDGVVKWVRTGFSEELRRELFEAIAGSLQQ